MFFKKIGIQIPFVIIPPRKNIFANSKLYDKEEIITSALNYTIVLIYCGFPISLSQEFAMLLGLNPPTYYYMQRGIRNNSSNN